MRPRRPSLEVNKYGDSLLRGYNDIRLIFFFRPVYTETVEGWNSRGMRLQRVIVV